MNALQLAVFDIPVTEDDDPVSDNTFSGRGAVQADLTLLARYYIRLEPLPVVQVADHHLLIRDHSGLFDDSLIDRDAALVGEIRFGHRGNVDLCPEYASQHSDFIITQ